MSSADATGIHFTNDATSHGIADTAWGWGTAFVDMDGDGAQDLYTAQGMREFVGNGSVHIFNANSFLFMNDGTGQNFAPATAPGCEVPGDQRALVVFDFNRDGAPDLLMTQVNGPPILLENLIADRNWLTVAVDGPNDAGIDATVSVTAGGRTQSQIILAGGSYLAGPPREAYFGLGSAAVADTVRIAWASGRTTELHDVPAGQGPSRHCAVTGADQRPEFLAVEADDARRLHVLAEVGHRVGRSLDQRQGRVDLC